MNKLEAIVESYNKGTYESADKVDNLKKISKLTWENQRLTNECGKYKTYWENQVRITENFRVAVFDAESERDEVLSKLSYYKEQY